MLYVLAGNHEQFRQYLGARGLHPGSAIYLDRVEKLIGAIQPEVIVTGTFRDYGLGREVQLQVEGRGGSIRQDAY